MVGGNPFDEAFDRISERFRADRAGDTRAVVHWRLTDWGPDEYARYEMVIEDGRIAVNPGRTRDAHVMVTLPAPDFLRLAGRPELFSSGRQCGDALRAAALPGFFAT
jgi:hypothetical protein